MTTPQQTPTKLTEYINGTSPNEVIKDIAEKLYNYSSHRSSSLKIFFSNFDAESKMLSFDQVLSDDLEIRNSNHIENFSFDNSDDGGVILFTSEFSGFDRNGNLIDVNEYTIYNLLTIFEYYLSVIEGTLLNGNGSDASVTEMLDNLKYTTGADGKRKLQRYQFIRTGDDINIDSISTSAFTIPGGSKKHRKTIKRNRK